MKIFPKKELRVANAKEMSRQGELAFTMVEIAIAIGVIGFALVAIIGILPTGMNVQKDNREDTVISQDAPYFLDAIRNGASVNNGALADNGYSAQGLDFLTNYVQAIRFDYVVNGVTNVSIVSNSFCNGAVIIGLLSTPQNTYNLPGFDSNYLIVTATNRALSGPATAQQNRANGLSSFMAFTYKMEVMITPFNSFAPATTNYSNPNLDGYQSNICYNRFVEATPGSLGLNNQPISNSVTVLPSPLAPGYGFAQPLAAGAGALNYNLFDVRLRFSWPVLANGNVGPGRQTYRTLVSAPLAPTTIGTTNVWFFQPQVFANNPPPNL